MSTDDGRTYAPLSVYTDTGEKEWVRAGKIRISTHETEEGNQVLATIIEPSPMGCRVMALPRDGNEILIEFDDRSKSSSSPTQ